MLYKAEYFSRILDKDTTKKQRLRSHLSNVAKMAQRFAKEVQPSRPDDSQDAKQWKNAFYNITWRAGALHDLGKYRTEFQEYLFGERDRGSETNHSVYGSAAAWHHFCDAISAFSIAGHHAGLYDCGNLDTLVNGKKYEANRRYPSLLGLVQDAAELGPLPEIRHMSINEDDEKEKRRYEFMTRILFSMIVDADRLDAERWEMEQKLGKSWQRPTKKLEAEELLLKIQSVRERKRKEHPEDDLNRLRNAIFDSCLEKGGNLPQGFFTLTVPTGGAKTLASMAFALAHANKHGLRRVIVVIPYLSIIEQNAKEYRDALGADEVLEHHSAVELLQGSRRADNFEADEPAEIPDMEKAMENWDIPVIVTTSVQFIETLFAAAPGKARKLHNIPRSVVIFDEVQTLPTHLLEPSLNIFRELKELWGVSFLFCSATQPAFNKSANLREGFKPGEVTEIAPDLHSTFKELRRTDYHIESKDNPWDWRAVAEKMISYPQALCVLNIRRHASTLWQTLLILLRERGYGNVEIQQGLFHLSSAMCPAHRLDILGLSKNPPPNNIKERLIRGKHCWVASTQLIEAGVDIDFPVVFRAIGPLDSIVQAAGRCNREGLLRDEKGDIRRGQVIVFYPQDAGLPPGIYSRGTNITPIYLDAERLAEDSTIFSQYFQELYQITPMDFCQPGQRTIQEDRAEFRFRKVAEHAKVIKDETISVITLYGPAKDMVAEIRRTNKFDYASLRFLQRYMVNIRDQGAYSDFAELKALGAIEPLIDGRVEIPVLGDWCYKTDPPLGVVIKDRPMEDFFQ